MATRHKIIYTMYEGKIITGHNPLLPIIRACGDSMAYGDVEFPVTETSSDEVESLTCQIYECDVPDLTETRYIRTGSDLYSTTVCDFSGLLIKKLLYKITFKFKPASLAPVDGDNYALEFFLTLDHKIPAIFSPKLIINIQNRFTF